MHVNYADFSSALLLPDIFEVMDEIKVFFYILSEKLLNQKAYIVMV